MQRLFRWEHKPNGAMKQLLMPLSLLISLMTGCDQQENFPVAARSGGAGNSHTRNTLTFVPTDWTFEVE